MEEINEVEHARNTTLGQESKGPEFDRILQLYKTLYRRPLIKRIAMDKVAWILITWELAARFKMRITNSQGLFIFAVCWKDKFHVLLMMLLPCSVIYTSSCRMNTNLKVSSRL
ncbi:uncharacterized protein LOC113349727 isoform X2 [Papaver somniferum]|uniref:uncharacterized protein LOC113349727 isoform X2 n=1 Tax=Papaver somniferum TaxID=3469 RepID=UPI000E6F78C9|nr:uncharacterized protein LOC113349727 isoform X2 [Papaver somniferum]